MIHLAFLCSRIYVVSEIKNIMYKTKNSLFGGVCVQLNYLSYLGRFHPLGGL